jgi:hypothetical protein
VFRADGFCGLESGDDFYLTDGASLFHLQPMRGQAEAQLATSFVDKPVLLQCNFRAFGLLKLLRSLGLYSLHAAGLVAREGPGLLLVAGSGSGKSTLALGLIRQGWGYLSDDAVLLRLQPKGVAALALRKDFYVDAGPAVRSNPGLGRNSKPLPPMAHLPLLLSHATTRPGIISNARAGCRLGGPYTRGL